MTRLTKSFVDKVELPALKPNGKHAQKFYRDSALPGFGLRVSDGGTKTFIIERRIAGKVKRMSLGRYGQLTCEQARKEAQKLLGNIAAGGDPAAEKRELLAKNVTLEDAFNDYLLGRKDLKSSTTTDYTRAIKTSLSDWVTKPLHSISKDMIEERHRELGQNSPTRANNTMRVLRAIFNFARYKYEDSNGGSLFAVNPVDRLSRNRGWYKVDRRRSLIKPHQLKPWYQATLQLNYETTRDYLHFLLFTGLRRSEAARLMWSEVDLADRTFTITETKNNEPHTLPLSDFLFDLLKRRQQHSEGQWVFPSPLTKGHLKEPRTAVARVEELSSVPFMLHDLRRTFITIAESLDIPAYALKRLLNHKDGNDVTAGYIVSSVDRLREPMQRISNFIEGCIDNE
jgi:integrase